MLDRKELAAILLSGEGENRQEFNELASRAGLRPSALRYYEEIGVLPAALRVNGRRRYSPEVLERVKVARFAQSVGFTLAEIRNLLAEPRRGALRARWRPLALAKLKELDQVIETARQMKSAISLGLECGCIRVEDCLPGKRKKP
jgi:MerR family redox-sensitive transcriptional activator SoxR